MQFTKMHGLGNDFVMVNCLGKEGEALLAEAQQRSAELCDRKFGVGGDGVIALLPGRNSRRTRCGCSTRTAPSPRCVATAFAAFAKYLYDRGIDTRRDKHSRGDRRRPAPVGGSGRF